MEKCKHDWDYTVRPIVCKNCKEEFKHIKIEDENTVIFDEGYIIIKKVFDKWGAWVGIKILTPEAGHTAVNIEGATYLTSQRLVSLKPDKDEIFI